MIRFFMALVIALAAYGVIGLLVAHVAWFYDLYKEKYRGIVDSKFPASKSYGVYMFMFSIGWLPILGVSCTDAIEVGYDMYKEKRKQLKFERDLRKQAKRDNK